LKNLFIARSLKNALDFFKEIVSSQEVARKKGLLQSLDARVKLILLLAFLVITISAKTLPVLIGLYLLSVILAVLSGINTIFFLKRVWVFIPIFTLFIAIPAIFIQGLSSAVLFVVRVATCVSFVIVVVITTRHDYLLKSLRSLGVPAIFVNVLDMTYRYIFLFMKVFDEMHIGLKSRLVKGLETERAHHWIASRIAFLFKKSLKMSEDVYMAMLARGYDIQEVKTNEKRNHI